jgi:hypothetical protein
MFTSMILGYYLIIVSYTEMVLVGRALSNRASGSEENMASCRALMDEMKGLNHGMVSEVAPVVLQAAKSVLENVQLEHECASAHTVKSLLERIDDGCDSRFLL